jgi:hypothetical protein
MDCALLAQVGKRWLAAVVAANLPRAGQRGAVRLQLKDFVGSVESLAWAKANGCTWRGLHSSTFQLNLSRLLSLIRSQTHRIPQNVLTLSREVDEC